MPSVEWETPQDFFDTLNKEFRFTLDACASKENAKLPFYFTYQQNALFQSWNVQGKFSRCAVWVNPPYNNKIGEWVRKCYETAQSGATVVCLLQCRSGDTKWWHNYVMKASEIRFLKDRLHFSFNGKSSRANISSVIVVFRPYCKGPPSTASINAKGEFLYK